MLIVHCVICVCTCAPPKEDTDSNPRKARKEEGNIRGKKNPESEKVVYLLALKY